MSPLYMVGVPLTLMVLGVVARTAVSPLGRRWASWLKSVIECCPSAASSALTASTFVSRRVSPARSTSRSVFAPAAPVRLAAQQEDRAARHEARGIAGEVVGHRVVVPHDVAHQVRRQGIDGAGRVAESRRGKPCPESGQYRGQAPAVR